MLGEPRFENGTVGVSMVSAEKVTLLGERPVSEQEDAPKSRQLKRHFLNTRR